MSAQVKIGPVQDGLLKGIAAALCAVTALSLPATGMAARVATGPRGAQAVVGPRGAAAVRGPNGAAAVRGPYGAAAVRGPNGATAVRGPYGARTGHTFYYAGRSYYGVYARPFIYPPGWAYRRWVVGAVLPAVFLTSTYYYTDYAVIGLAAPPVGYRWVRYGPDLLLVNIHTGAVAHVAYGVFG